MFLARFGFWFFFVFRTDFMVAVVRVMGRGAGVVRGEEVRWDGGSVGQCVLEGMDQV